MPVPLPCVAAGPTVDKLDAVFAEVGAKVVRAIGRVQSPGLARDDGLFLHRDVVFRLPDVLLYLPEPPGLLEHIVPAVRRNDRRFRHCHSAWYVGTQRQHHKSRSHQPNAISPIHHSNAPSRLLT